MSPGGLSDVQYATIRAVLARHARKIERVALFGSRVGGCHRAGSDVDLALFGPEVDDRALAAIREDFEESNLSLNVDLLAYEQLEPSALRNNIDKYARTLFTRKELLAQGIKT